MAQETQQKKLLKLIRVLGGKLILAPPLIFSSTTFDFFSSIPELPHTQFLICL